MAGKIAKLVLFFGLCRNQPGYPKPIAHTYGVINVSSGLPARHQMARKLGKQDHRSIRIERKISHEELSEMVGATRPRISKFMQRFRILGLIETSAEHFLIIKEKKFTDYLTQIINSGYRAPG
jgi:hypothetical protein